MASISQFTEMFLKWPLKNISEILICPWMRLWWMGATWLYEHKQYHKKSSLKLLVRFWNNLIEIFLEWPFSELFLKFWSVNKHGISEWRLLALYRHKEILVNSSLKATKKRIGKSNLKKSGERSRAILALLLSFINCQAPHSRALTPTCDALVFPTLNIFWKMCIYDHEPYYCTMPHFDTQEIYSCEKHCEKRKNCL